MKFVLVLMLISSPARAGWIGRICEGWLIADDPYQYAEASDAWLDKEIERHEIKRRWGKLDQEGYANLKILIAEVRRRDRQDALAAE